VLESARRPGRFVVTLTDGRLFTVAIGALSETGATRTGVELSAEAVGVLARESLITEVSDRAMNTLARGRRTRWELEIRLRRVQPDATVVAEALNRLVDGGILSDAEVARAEAASRLRRGEAPARVRQVLRQKGIEGTMVQEALSAAVLEDGFDEAQACRALAEKRRRTLGEKEPEVIRRRLIAFLQRRGFGGRLITGVVNDILRSQIVNEVD
jgi:regulatory protein